MKIYKQGQGHTTRVGAIVLAAIIGLYAGFCWFFWCMSGTGNTENFLAPNAIIGSVLLLGGCTWLGIWLSLYKEVSGEFLIDVDTELRKVVWPEVLPLFDPKTNAWGSTYVVIITTVVLTIYIGVVDVFLDQITSYLLGLLLLRG